MPCTFREILRLETLPKVDYIKGLQRFGLVSKDVLNPKSRNSMQLKPKNDLSDGFAWRCNRSGCKVVRSLRNGTWCSKSKLTLREIMLSTYMWCRKYTQQLVIHETGIRSEAVVNRFNFCGEVSTEIVGREKVVLGGPGRIVQIDERMFGKRKYNRGSRKKIRQWVFSGIENDSNKCFLVKVDERDARTLVALIKKFILPGTTIYIDCRKAYDRLKEKGYEHLTVNHSVTFVDGEVHTNKIEGLWRHVKRSFPQCRRTKDLLDSYLSEFMWRRLRSDRPCIFEAFLLDAAKVYVPYG
ncbi:uncharacterized protein [Bemisia tabaci]|uniref:uncharacterized protein n=1 Tax=Bemisia tabaci TaxID=7038 RepID=UPI003B28748C